MARNINTASDWLNIFTKVYGRSYSLQLFIFKCLEMASCPPVLPALNMSPQAIQKRGYRAVQREKRRRSFFIHDYIRIKYPHLFTEANSLYQQFVDKYPSKADFTKSYYFKKWEREMNRNNNPVMMPHLPILVPADMLQQAFNQTVVAQHPPEDQQQPPQVQQQPPPEDQQLLSEVQQQPPPEDQQQLPEVQQQQQQPPQVQQQLPEVQQTIEVQSTESNQLTSGMSLDEMDLAVDQIVNALQSDRLLMDLVEELDLPPAVWDNELVIPDYLLETDLDW